VSWPRQSVQAMPEPGSIPDRLPHHFVQFIDYFFGLGWRKDDDAERVLDVQKIKRRYRHYRAIKHGYTGLVLFLFFMFSYVFVLGQQHRASAIGKPNESLQTMFELLKADTKDKDSASIYNTLTKVVVPKLHTGDWQNTTISGEKISGRTAFEYYHVIGGIVLTAVKGKSHQCFRGNRCYAQDKIKDPFHTFKVPGESVSFSVPYNADMQGYSVSLPGSSSVETLNKLVAGFKGLFGPDTREVWLHAVLFNPSGQKTITNVAYGATVDVDSMVHFSTKISTIPYHFYDPDHFYFQLVCELSTVAFALWAFVIPIFQYVFLEPRPKDGDYKDQDYRIKWVAWSHLWKHLPQKGGRPSLATPTVFYLGLFCSILFHIFLGILYNKLGRLGDKDLDWLFIDPLAKCTDISSMMTNSMEVLEARVVPFITLIQELAIATTRYFFVHTILMTICVMRLQQYFAFQKRLAIVSDTFSGIFDDLLHLGIVVLLVCFFFGVLNSLAFGAYDPPFRSFWTAFCEMVLVCFGMYKPSAGNPFILSMFKYTPHVLNTTEFMSWEPVLLQILFKTFVILLLFKLLMGVIMEGYKKHSRLKNKATTVRQDFAEIWDEFYQHVRAQVLGTPHVSLFHIALAMSYLNRKKTDNRETAPWENYFVGLDHRDAIKDALNAVLKRKKGGKDKEADEKRTDMSIHAKAKIKSYSLKVCEDQEVDYVLRIFGTNRQRAKVKFAQLWKDKMTAKADKVEAKAAEEAKKTKAEAEADKDYKRVSELIDSMRQTRLTERETIEAFQVGVAVETHSLTGVSEMNGKRGTVITSFDGTHVEVQHEGEEGPCHHDPKNLKLVQAISKEDEDFRHKIFNEDELSEIFTEYDITSIGTIDHRLMPQVFRQLGYKIPGKTLAHLLAFHDDDEDGDVSFKEFKVMMADDRLVGLWHGVRGRIERTNTFGEAKSIERAFSTASNQNPLTALQQPLLSVMENP